MVLEGGSWARSQEAVWYSEKTRLLSLQLYCVTADSLTYSILVLKNRHNLSTNVVQAMSPVWQWCTYLSPVSDNNMFLRLTFGMAKEKEKYYVIMFFMSMTTLAYGQK